MAFIYYNPNPAGRNVGDCSVRAISKALKIDWETAYISIVMNGYSMGGDEMIMELRELMEDAPDEKTRMEFQRFIKKMEQM